MLSVSFSNIFYNVDAQTNNVTNTFEDPKTGITFQYPPNWQVASKDYTNSLFGTSDDPFGAVKPIVALLPDSFNGASFAILTEILPFPVSVEKYYETFKTSLLSDPSVEVSNAVPISLVGTNGIKFNITYYYPGEPDNIQTQIAIIKDSTAFTIGSNLGYDEQSKDRASINSIINSLTFKGTTNGSESQ